MTTATAAEKRAARLAKEAGEIAASAGLKSAYLRQDGAAFIAEFKVTRSAQKVRIERKGQEPADLKLADIKKFVNGGAPEVGKVMRPLCSGTRLYGRKFAALTLAHLAQDEA